MPGSAPAPTNATVNALQHLGVSSPALDILSAQNARGANTNDAPSPRQLNGASKADAPTIPHLPNKQRRHEDSERGQTRDANVYIACVAPNSASDRRCVSSTLSCWGLRHAAAGAGVSATACERSRSDTVTHPAKTFRPIASLDTAIVCPPRPRRPEPGAWRELQESCLRKAPRPTTASATTCLCIRQRPPDTHPRRRLPR